MLEAVGCQALSQKGWHRGTGVFLANQAMQAALGPQGGWAGVSTHGRCWLRGSAAPFPSSPAQLPSSLALPAAGAALPVPLQPRPGEGTERSEGSALPGAGLGGKQGTG